MMEMKEPADETGNGCCLRGIDWLALKLKLVQQGATPPKWKYILLIFSCLFVSSISLTYLFSFLPEMILHLGYSENEKGFYVGLVASSVFAGRIFGSIFWGWLSDRKGRKFVLLSTVLMTGVSAASFGFSVNIPMAMALRFLCGLLNGLEVTSKAALYDVSDNSNQAVGMTVLSFAWGSGLMSGPLIAGFLASPCTRWPHVFYQDGLFGQFPYLLSCLLPLLLSIIVFFLLLFKFDETYITSCRTPVEIQVEKEEEEVFDFSQMDTTLTKTHCDSYRLHELCPNYEGTKTLYPNHKGRKTTYPNHEGTKTLYPNHEGTKTLYPNHEGTKTLYPNHKGTNEINSQSFINILSSSLNSLNPEIELSVCLGKEALDRRNITLNTQNLSFHKKSMSQPELNLAVQKEINESYLYLLEEPALSKSATSIGIPTGSKLPPLSSNNCCNGTEEMDDKHLLYQMNQGKGDTADSLAKPEGQEMATCQPSTSPLLLGSSEELENICNCCDRLCRSSCCRVFTHSSLHKLLRLRDVWATVLLFSLMAMTTLVIDELFPVFASTRTDYGGLGFSSDEIGMAIGVFTIPLLTFQVKLYPFLVNKFGIRKAFMAMAFVCMISSQSITVLRALNNSPIWLWVCLAFVMIPFKMAVNCCFASISLLLNNSVTQDLAGQVNGLSLMATAMGRTVVPVLAGSMYSWTVSTGQFIGPPLDVGLTFFVFGLLYGVSLVGCLFISPRLDRQKK